MTGVTSGVAGCAVPAATTTGGRTWTTFPTLGTSAYLAVRDSRDLRLAEASARALLDLVDAGCSRFRDDSSLNEVNRHAGSWVPVDQVLLGALTVALDAAAATDGLVDPLLGRTLVSWGYDRDFAELRTLPDRPGLVPASEAHGTWRDVEVDPAGAVRIPSGTALDLGATGKAWAADVIAEAWSAELRGAALVSLGGDLRIASPDGHPWPIAVSERPGEDPAAIVTLDSGGLATSSTQVRRWARAGVRHHHLVDPRTGRPADEVWRTVTATGPTCSAANTATTAAIVLGDAAPTWLTERGVDARLVTAGGAVVTVGAWPRERTEVLAR